MRLRPWYDNLWRSVTEYQTGRHFSGEPDVIPFSDDFFREEWCPEFERLMRNRLLQGSLRYGRLGSAGKKQWNRPKDILRRVKLYMSTGNDELLADIANLALLEFVEGVHPNKHFSSVDDGEHTKPA